MRRNPTFSELCWPDDPADANLPVQWASDVATQVLGWTWRAFDALRSNHLAHVDLAQPLEQLERDLTRNHFIEIQLIFREETDGYQSFVPHYEYPEMESRADAPARPPAYDLAFVALSNRRWVWPLEAKVIRSSNRLGEYLKDVNDKFLECVAAPIVGEGAMIAYLITSEPIAVFENLSGHLDQPLEPCAEFSDRPHRVSHHSRNAAPDLRLHHMLMRCDQPTKKDDSP